MPFAAAWGGDAASYPDSPTEAYPDAPVGDVAETPLSPAEHSQNWLESFDTEDYEPDLELRDLMQTLGIDPAALSRLLSALSDTSGGNATQARKPAENAAKPGESPQWYLGLDVGTTGISAVLLRYPAGALHPIYWLELPPVSERDDPYGNRQPARKTFRLPVQVQLSAEAESEQNAAPIAIAPLSASLGQLRTQQPHRLSLSHLKPYLRVGVPYYSTETLQWEPVARWSDTQALPLSLFQQALRTLLVSLVLPAGGYVAGESASATPLLTCGAVDLEEAQFQLALRQLAGVIVSYPANWSDTYSFNLREAILSARLVSSAAQIFLLEEAIATLLSGLPRPDARPLRLSPAPAQPADLYSGNWQGGTLVLSAGATLTELALVNIPSQLQHLSHCDMVTRTLPYAGTALDQDILIQLVYPAWVRQTHAPQSIAAELSSQGNSLISNPDRTDWSNPSRSPEVATDPWLAVGWDDLTLPAAGDPDPAHRDQMLQRLRSSDLGLWLLQTAERVKIALQQQEQVSLTLGSQTLVLMRHDLSSRVLLPYVERLNRELNALLRQTGLSRLEIRQVVCSGGSASLVAIARWLHQKLPNATIIQDTYLSAGHASTACSRVAYGLAALPLHPQVLNQARHQTSDYYLLMELLRTFPEHPVTLDSVLHILERRGIDTAACRQHILALLEGHLPPGLVPMLDSALVAPTAASQSTAARLLEAPLFFKQDDHTYRPNLQQWQRLRAHLDTLLATTYQKLNEPLQVLGVRGRVDSLPGRIQIGRDEIKAKRWE
ncbi:MAG: hypothetical protein OHK0037_01610 [Elainellaceae cyanobacterium]